MDAIPWMVVISLVILFFVLTCKVFLGGNDPAPPARPGPKPELPSPDYLRKWTLGRKLSEQSEMRRWQAEFAGIQLQLARRAGGLQGSSTAAPETGGYCVPPQGSEPRIAQGARREGEAGASGEPPGRKNEKIWRKLSDTLSELERNGAGSSGATPGR